MNHFQYKKSGDIIKRTLFVIAYVPTTGILSNYLLATYRKSVSILSRAINDKAADKAEISLIQSLF